MTATNGAALPKTNRETWHDWMAPGAPEPEPLFTRAELLARLGAQGFDVDETTLVYWEKFGVLPRAVRRWHGGKQAALYPEWMVKAASVVAQMQGAGSDLRTIRPEIRQMFRRAESEEEREALDRAEREASNALKRAALAYADVVGKETGKHAAAVAITVLFSDGDKTIPYLITRPSNQ